MPTRTALVTGASSGIGEAFARQLAARGYELILVARSRDKLLALAASLRAAHGRRVEVVAADLSQPAPGSRLIDAAQALGMPVDLLVNNAGFGLTGPFERQDEQRQREMVMLNVAAVADLARVFAGDMLRRGGGGIINVASLAALQAMPEMSLYAASKAFVLSLSVGLWSEYRGRGINVVCVCPGPVDTPFFEHAGAAGARRRVPDLIMASADEVVRMSLKALRRRRPIAFTNRGSVGADLASRLLPRSWVARVVGGVLADGAQ